MGICLITYFVAGAMSYVVGEVVYITKVLPVLRRHDSFGILARLFLIHFLNDLKDYKRICIIERKSLFWYYTLYTAWITDVVLVVIGIVFMLVFYADI